MRFEQDGRFGTGMICVNRSVPGGFATCGKLLKLHDVTDKLMIQTGDDTGSEDPIWISFKSSSSKRQV